MPSGYEKSPDYGSPSPTWIGFIAPFVVIAAIVLGLVYIGTLLRA